MVKKGSAFAKNSRREIRKTLGRYVAILAIIALGVGFFTGLRVTRQAMITTGDRYLQRQNFYDFRLISTIGLTEEDAAYFAALDGVKEACGNVSTDFLRRNEDGTEAAWKALMISEINAPQLRAGRMPEAPDECLADALGYSEAALGTTVTVSPSNTDSIKEMFRYDSYTIVGLCDSPLYLNFERGTSSLGDGTISGFYCFPAGAFDTDYYTEVYVTIEKTGGIFTDQYETECDTMEPVLTEALEARASLRGAELAKDAKEEYNKGFAEYLQKREEADEELNLARVQLAEAKEQLAQARQEIADGEEKLKKGREQYDKGLREYRNGAAMLESKKAEAFRELDDYQSQLDDGLRQARAAVAVLEVLPSVSEYNRLPGDIADLKQRLAEAEEGTLSYYTLSAELALAERTLASLTGSELVSQYLTAKETLNDLNARQAELSAARAQAEAELAGAQAELNAAKAQLDSALYSLKSGEKKLADGKQEYQNGLAEYSRGLTKYNDGVNEARESFTEAEEELADARSQIRALVFPTTYVLDRSTNTGYVCYDSDSQIVFGVSKVFPIFFFMVAALVCITTMTRMVDDQRTQIGTLKALGYSNGKIVWKYVSYSGSAALLGCIIGFFVGSALFPTVIWFGYSLMYGFGGIDVVYNWGLGLVALAVSLACSAGATYLACRKDLHQVPAELMRPRAPKAGKRILLERIGFLWRRFSFLHKVTVRNIFRYKKRLIMMVLGIGGCTALVITGLGLRDSICNIADDQFSTIMKYDYGIVFSGDATDEERLHFAEENSDLLEECVLLCSASSDANCGDSICSVNILACSDEHLHDVMELSFLGEPVSLPPDGSVIVSSNLAEKNGLSVGDTLALTEDGITVGTLPISGIFKNYVYSYVLMNETTYSDVFGKAPVYNTIFANADPDVDLHEASAELISDRGAASVSVMADFRERISNMLKSMNYIVALVIGCAAALAFVVLFNLSNINLTERAREIATIKVLGFYPKESSAYVFRENIVLTLLGSLLGLPLGKFLHAYVMQQIKLDMIAFEVRVTWLSYLMSVVLTFVFTFIVDLLMRRKLNAIDMAESLKSVE